MSNNKPIRRVAIVGTGVIGASWSAQYLARGLDVVATDPAPNAEANLRKYVDEAWPDLTSIGLSQGASPDRLSFTDEYEGRSFAGGLRPGKRTGAARFKMKLFAEMDDVTPVNSLLASSSSGITPSVIQKSCKRPERPCRPSFQSPAYHSVGRSRWRQQTSPDAVQRALRFYASIGKKPIHLRKELPGHVANRFQAALYREMLYLIEEGVLSVRC